MVACQFWADTGMGTDSEYLQQIYGEFLEQPLSEREQALRREFVKQYLVDYDAHAAALRVGFLANIADDYAKQFMGESFVQKLIAEHESKVALDEGPEREAQKKRVMAQLMREAHFTGKGSSHAARVAALGKLAALFGLEPQSGAGSATGPQGGVMVVPARVSANDWENGAASSQGALKAAVRE